MQLHVDDNGLGLNTAKTELCKIVQISMPVLYEVVRNPPFCAKLNIKKRTQKGLIALNLCRDAIGKSLGLRPQIVH